MHLSHNNTCPLCSNKNTIFFSRDRVREYIRCTTCGLIFVPKQFQLDRISEKARYDLHVNSMENHGYRKFLSTLITPIEKLVSKGAVGLDFGSGPVPVMANMLIELGYEMEIYDKYYADDERVLLKNYDFITCCETIEHFSQPEKELKLMVGLLKPAGSVLGIKTSLYDDHISHFTDWHYSKDQTHISFFCHQSMQWIKSNFGFQIVDERESTFVFRKKQ